MTLPDSFNNRISEIETLLSDKITLEFVKSKTLAEEIRRHFRSSTRKDNSSVNPAFGTSTNHLLKCNFCHIPGHKKQSC